MNDKEKIENLEKEIQSLKGIIEILAKDAKFTPVKAVSTPAIPTVEILEDSEEIIDIFPESYEMEDFDIEDGILHEYLGENKEVTIPYGVTKIGNGAFKNNQKIEKINFSETVKEIGTEAFAKCANLAAVNISGNNVVIGSKAFSDCFSLEKIDIENVKEISDHAFAHCSNLKRLRFSEKTEKIGSHAFSLCSNLRISVPETCKCIYAFNGCKSVVVREKIK